MTRSSLSRLLIRIQIGSLVGFILAAPLALLVMVPFFLDGLLMEHDGDHVEKTGAAIAPTA